HPLCERIRSSRQVLQRKSKIASPVDIARRTRGAYRYRCTNHHSWIPERLHWNLRAGRISSSRSRGALCSRRFVCVRRCRWLWSRCEGSVLRAAVGKRLLEFCERLRALLAVPCPCPVTQNIREYRD